jgi:hypothetical protein
VSDERLQVTVAVTNPFDLVFRVRGRPAHGARYDDLPKASVDATAHETLRTVLGRAADALGVAPADDYLESLRPFAQQERRTFTEPHVSELLVYSGFWRPDDDEIIWRGQQPDDVVRRRDQRLLGTVQVVRDAAGRAVWRKPALEATYAELLDAAGSGLVIGDPLRPYLIPSIPQGDPGTFGEWQHFIDALKVLWEATDAAARFGGAWGAYELVKRALQRRCPAALETVERTAPQWHERGAAPADLFRFLIGKARSTDEIAALLGCRAEEAEAILWAFGFVFVPEDDRWQYKGDATAELLGDDIDLIFADVFTWPEWRGRLEGFTRRRLQRLGTTARAPSLEDAREEVIKLADSEVAQLKSPLRRIVSRCRGRRR